LRSSKAVGYLTAACLLAGILMVLFLPGSLLSEEDAKAPDFTLANLEGEDVTLSELLAGGPVILDFWATWCKPCIRGFPGLEALVTKYKDRGLTVVAVSVDGPKSRARVAPFIHSRKYSFEVLFDTQGRVAKKYNAMTIPRTVLISPEGGIAYATVGYRPSNHEQIEKSLIPLLPRIATEGGEVVE
jgi:peroxiredoxin